MVEPHSPSPLKLRFTDGDVVGKVKVAERAVIGRGDDADVKVDDAKASRHHAEIVRDAGGWLIRDLGSSNGTYVNGKRIGDQGVKLRDGDVVRVGRREATVMLPDVTVLDRSDDELGPASGDPETPGGAQTDSDPGAPQPAQPARPDGDTGAPHVAHADGEPGAPAALPLKATQPAEGAVDQGPHVPASEQVSGPEPPTAQDHAAQPERPSGLKAAVRSLSRPGHTTLLRDLSRTTRRAVIVAAVAVIVAVGVAIAALAGAFSQSTNEGFTAAEIVHRVRPSTVLITTRNRGKDDAQLGSGWVINAKQGLIITNGHVAELGGLGVVLNQGAQRPARVVAMHRCADVALLQVADRRGMATMPMGDQAHIDEGDNVVAVGFPGSFSQATGSAKAPLVTTTGTVSLVKDRLNGQEVGNPYYTNVIQTDAAINHGNSGGPLMQQRTGRLIGINTLGANDKQNQNYAVAVDRIRELLPDLTRGVSHGWMGLGLEDPTDDELAQNIYQPAVASISNPDLTRAGVTAPSDAGAWRLAAVNGVAFGAGSDQLPPISDGHCTVTGRMATGQPVQLTFTAPNGRTVNVTTRMQ